MRKVLWTSGAPLLVAGLVLGMATPAGAEPSATIDDIALEECDIIVTFTVGDAGEYHLVVWDDQVEIGDVPVTAEAGTTVQGRYTITSAVQQNASGLGINIESAEGEIYAEVDPYNGADHLIEFCSTGAPGPVPEAPTTTTVPPVDVPEAPLEVAPAAVPVVVDPDYTG